MKQSNIVVGFGIAGAIAARKIIRKKSNEAMFCSMDQILGKLFERKLY